jgi:hypothetical protein
MPFNEPLPIDTLADMLEQHLTQDELVVVGLPQVWPAVPGYPPSLPEPSGIALVAAALLLYARLRRA